MNFSSTSTSNMDQFAAETDFHEGWYPVVPGATLTAGDLVGVEFLSGKVVAFRDPDGAPAVLGAYCCHMGADLSVGTLIDGCVQCAFHHWSFDRSGQCVSIPVAGRIPKRARQYSYPTVEALGLVWAYNGEGPPPPRPSFRGHEDRSFEYVVSEPLELPLPPWSIVANAIDLQHIETLHGMTITADPVVTYTDHSVAFDLVTELPNVGEVVQRSTIHGTSTLTMSGGALGLEVFAVAAGAPLPGGGSRFWFVAGAPSETPAGRRRALLTVGMQSIREFIRQDEPVLRTMHLRRGVMVEADRVLVRYLNYVDAFPRRNPGAKWLT